MHIFCTKDYLELAGDSPFPNPTILSQMLEILCYAAGLSTAAYHEISSVQLQYCRIPLIFSGKPKHKKCMQDSFFRNVKQMQFIKHTFQFRDVRYQNNHIIIEPPVFGLYNENFACQGTSKIFFFNSLKKLIC